MSTRVVQLASVALILLAAGCAGPVIQNGSASTQPGALPSATALDLTGTWRGSFGEIASYTGQVHGDIVYAINGDGTYKATWVSYVVAGSSRGGRREMSGRVVANGRRVTFNDASGSQMVLTRKGNTLYGMTLDPMGKRVNLAIELHRAPETP